MINDRARHILTIAVRTVLGRGVTEDLARAAEDGRLGRWGAWFRFRRYADLVLPLILGLALVALYTA